MELHYNLLATFFQSTEYDETSVGKLAMHVLIDIIAI